MMETPGKPVGKVFLIFAGMCLVALPFIVLTAFSYQPEETRSDVLETPIRGFDQNGDAVFRSDTRIAKDYLEGVSTERTLDQYYSRRVYAGSPPYISHTVEEPGSERVQCLACHARGGWTEALKRHTPLTPHPEMTACRQCHVVRVTDQLFVGIDWTSVSTPRLGRAHLPGAPPHVPHTLDMRGDCHACHVGPGAVSTIRVEHPSRGNCRQCHVPESVVGYFKRIPS